MRNFSFIVIGEACLDRKFNTGITGGAERLAAFDEAIKVARQRAVNYVFVAGDLFDSSNPSPEVLRHVSAAFESLPAKVIISPGKCDPCSVGSCYQTYYWPSNVYIFPKSAISYIEFGGRSRGTSDVDYVFSGGRESVRKGVRIYGSAFESHFCKQSMLVTKSNRTPRLSSSYLNVLVMQGTAVTDETSSYNPVPLNVLNECGFDLCVLGGDLSAHRKGSLIVPGTICPNGFENTGESGVFAGEVEDSGLLSAELISVSPVKYERFSFDITGRPDLTAPALANDISKLVIGKNCIKVDVTGELGFDSNLDLQAVGKLLEKDYPLVQICDRTVKRTDLYLFNSERSFRGLFTSSICDTVRQVRDEARKSGVYKSESSYESAVNLGLKIMDNMDVKGSYSSLKQPAAVNAAEEPGEEAEGYAD